MVVFLRNFELFLIQLERSQEEQRLRGEEVLLKLGGSCGVLETGCGWLTAVRLAKVTSRPAKVTARRLGTFYKLNGKGWSFLLLAGIQEGRKNSWLREKPR